MTCTSCGIPTLLSLRLGKGAEQRILDDFGEVGVRGGRLM